jgi:hypothetical protein
MEAERAALRREAAMAAQAAAAAAEERARSSYAKQYAPRPLSSAG